MKRIKKIGVEIEGGWDRPIPADIYYDGSVDVEGERYGEICSPPLSLSQLERWIRNNYPDHVNKTCGFHIHLSFKNSLDYSRLMSKEFYEYFLFQIEKWAREYGILPNSSFWNRLAGCNSYCKKRFAADEQVQLSGKESIRYTHLNYCFRLHGTLECRLFPAWKRSDTAIASVYALVNIVESWLSQCSREKTYKLQESFYEEGEPERIIISDEIDASPETRKEMEICV